jgi:hypothetical protein
MIRQLPARRVAVRALVRDLARAGEFALAAMAGHDRRYSPGR